MTSQDEIEALSALVNVTEMFQEQTYASMAKFFDDLFMAFSSKLKTELRPETIDSSYTGIHLNEAYEEGDFLRMIESFRNGQIIHAKYALQIIEDAIKKYQTFPNISECNFKKSKTQLAGIIVVGDLHGSFKDLYYIISQFGVPGKSYRFVFNGDFVDRGPQQSECLLTLLYAFLMYPSRVFLNRGNHEDLSLNLNNHFSPNFKRDTENKFGKFSLAVFNQAQRLFRRLPIATIIENNVGFRCFVTHGGISEKIDLNYINSSSLNRFQFASININRRDTAENIKMAEQLSDLLWSDPSSDYGCVPNHHRGIGWLFGPDVTENFCRENGFSALIRSHECRDNGMTKDHPNCFTIFSSSRYCGGRNQAAVLIIDANKIGISTKAFDILPLRKDDHEKEKRKLIKNFKLFLNREANELLAEFQNNDQNSSGTLDINTWASILAEHIKNKIGVNIEPKHFVTLKDLICPCDETNYTAEYSSMFQNVKSQESNRIFEFLTTLFNLIDIDRNGWISWGEAQQAIEIMNRSLGTNYSSSFIQTMDLNQDGKVDLNEFKAGFSKAYNL